jgi:ribonuclease-3
MYNPYNSRNCLISEEDIKTILGKHKCSFNIRNLKLFQMAMVHTSYVKRSEYTSPTGEIIQLVDKPSGCLELFDDSYERLEHLGDSILGATISTYLVKRYPQEQEGFLTDLKKEIVCNEMLGSLSMKIGLNKFYIISRHNEDACNGRTNTKKLGDILEAFIGALWIDSGNDFKVISSFIINLVETYIDIPKILMNNRNFKEQLQKYCQATFHYTPTYKMLSSGLNSYTMAAINAKSEEIGHGTSQTKKQAEQLAAQDALLRFRNSTNK